jgi:hypothetical protein
MTMDWEQIKGPLGGIAKILNEAAAKVEKLADQ